MALYKYEQHVKRSSSDAFNYAYEPGAETPHAGIYQCTGCGDEIGIAKGHALPPQNHHQHTILTGPIEWKLIVFAQQMNN